MVKIIINQIVQFLEKKCQSSKFADNILEMEEMELFFDFVSLQILLNLG